MLLRFVLFPSHERCTSRYVTAQPYLDAFAGFLRTGPRIRFKLNGCRFTTPLGFLNTAAGLLAVQDWMLRAMDWRCCTLAGTALCMRTALHCSSAQNAVHALELKRTLCATAMRTVWWVSCRRVGLYIAALWASSLPSRFTVSCSSSVGANNSGWFLNQRLISLWRASLGDVPEPISDTVRRSAACLARCPADGSARQCVMAAHAIGASHPGVPSTDVVIEEQALIHMRAPNT